MQSAGAARDRLCDPTAEVSAHYLIGCDGTVWRLVNEDMRAWHAGAGSWQGKTDINSRSIGIELDNRGDHPFSEPLMAALETLLGGILHRWNIGPEGVIGHSDMAPDRKQDPGRRFDWQRLAREGLSVWPEPGIEGDFWLDARRLGYPDAEQSILLDAFRQRFRPEAHGALDATDRQMMHSLAERFGVDPGAASA